MNRPAKFLVALIVLFAAATPAQATSHHPVSGKWQQLISAVPTSYDPFTHVMDFVGASSWTGTWTGVTHYHAHGTVDLLTGQGEAKLYETFFGLSDDGGRGRLSFVEYVTVGAAGVTHIDTRIVGGAGDFAGARGRVRFDGVANTVTGSGTYDGWWTRPSTTKASA